MSEKRFVAEQVDVVNEDETEVWDIVFDTENTYAFMVRDMDTANELCGLLNEQQALLQHKDIHIQYWRQKCNSLLWILSQFDNAKVKELIEEVESEGFDLRNRILESHIKGELGDE